jgi:diadenosine tetraphosphate (Ap4A) HIT family hydrolase
MNDSNFPWIILVPKLEGIVEITDLDDTEYAQLNKEIRLIARAMQHELGPDKLNIAAIGNIVSQLHVHVIARYKNDALFPKPVWGHEPVKYLDAKLEDRINSLRKAIELQI